MLVRITFLLYSPHFYIPSFLFPVSYADSHLHAALGKDCMKKLRQIHAGLQMPNETQMPLKQTHLQPQPHISSNSAICYQGQLEDCSLLLLTHLMELQEVQASALLTALMDKVSQDNHNIHSKDSTITQALLIKHRLLK